MEYPVIFFTAALFIALFVFNCFGFYAAAAALLLSLIGAGIFYGLRKKNKHLHTLMVICMAVTAASTVFAVRTACDYMPAVSLADGAEHTLSGTILSFEEKDDRYYYTLKDVTVDGNAVKPSVRISSKVYRHVSIGDKVMLPTATIYVLGQSTGAEHIYKADGLYLGAYTNEYFEIESPERRPAAYYLDALRRFITETLFEYMDFDSAAVANAMLTGDRSRLSDALYDGFKFSGVAHLFAVSGFHLSLWSAVIAFALNRAFGERRKLNAVITILFVIIFAAMTGFSKSVLRAGIMMIIMQCGQLFGRDAYSLNSLFTAVGLILFVNPFSAVSPSLMLSFFATFGILVFAPMMTEQLRLMRKKINSDFAAKCVTALYSTFVISLIAALFTIPVSVYVFGCYSVLSPVTNVLVFLFAQFSMLLSGIAVIFSSIGAIAKPLFILCRLMIKYIIFITGRIGRLPFSVARADTSFTEGIFALAAVILVVLSMHYMYENGKMKRLLAAAAAFTAVISAVLLVIQYQQSAVTVVSVGNGTAVVYSHKNQHIVIGCGGGAYSEYHFTNELNKINTGAFAAVIVPRSKDTESRYARTVLKNYQVETAVLPAEYKTVYLAADLPPHVESSGEYKMSLDENTTLVYIDNEDFSGVRVTSADFTCTVIFKPNVDFSAVPDEWCGGDLLITRQKLPCTDLTQFDTIFVSDKTEIIYADDNVYSTSQNGTLQYRKWLVGGGTVYAAE